MQIYAASTQRKALLPRGNSGVLLKKHDTNTLRQFFSPLLFSLHELITTCSLRPENHLENLR